MKENKEKNRTWAKDVLKRNGITYQSFNNDLHWKIGDIDFYPTTQKWSDKKNGSYGIHVEDLIDYIKSQPKPLEVNGIRKISIEELFYIAKKVQPLNLYDVCQAIHEAVYNQSSEKGQ